MRTAARGQIDWFRAEDSSVDAPTGIIGVGNDIWFTSIGNGRVGRVDAAGRLETFADPAAEVVLPANIYPGSDGRVWFTCLGSNRLGAIDPAADDPAASIVTYPHPDLDHPVALKASPDGRLWFSLRDANAVGCLDPRVDPPLASLAVFASPSMSQPSALFALDDGRIWWVNAGTGTIGRLDPAADDPAASVTTLGPWPAWGAPRAWAVEESGGLFVTTQARPGLLHLDPAAADVAGSEKWFTDGRLQTPDGVWCAADGAVWMADTAASRLFRFEPGADADQRWTCFGAETELRGPFDIKAGGDPSRACLWFTDKLGNAIGRVAT